MRAIIIAMMLSISAAHADPPHLVDGKTGKYLGDLSGNRYDPDSTSNPYGRYGSKYSADSINNPYGQLRLKFQVQHPAEGKVLRWERRTTI